MSGIALFSEILANFEASRCKRLDEDLGLQGGIEAVYALVWPDYEPPVENHPLANRGAFSAWRKAAGVPLWAWFNCKENQAEDAATIAKLDRLLSPDGWLLDIEGEWTKGASLKTICEAAVATGKPVRASLAGMTPSHVPLDFRTCDRLGIPVDWQSYFDSGEGCTPAVAVQELYQSSFVIPGEAAPPGRVTWEYRHRIGQAYGWGKVTGVANELAGFDSYLHPTQRNAVFGVLPREWGWTVDDRILWPLDPDLPPSGLLMGRAAYANIRVTLETAGDHNDDHTLEEWTQIAASARIPNARKRPISVYLAEVSSDDVLAAIAEGAA
jgi:hypothetical protein